jgi:hypothetical protein
MYTFPQLIIYIISLFTISYICELEGLPSWFKFPAFICLLDITFQVIILFEPKFGGTKK